MSCFTHGDIPSAGSQQQQLLDNHLPQELITEILSWLPLKSLLRFRCVSTIWLRLLTADTAFFQLHHHRSSKTKNHNFVLIVGSEHPKSVTAIYNVQEYARAPASPVKLDLPFDEMNYPYGICNGLLYLTADDYSPDLFICNPLTGDHVSIQCPRIPLRYPLGGRKFNFGFGPCQGNNHYKVVRLLSSKYVSEFQSDVVVHTLGTDSWRTLESIPYKILSNPKLVCGALHWLGALSGSSFQNEIVSFDIETEIFRGIQPPNDVQFKPPLIVVTIGDLNGLLHIYSCELGQSLQIWAMKNYGAVDSWAKLYQLDGSMCFSLCSLLEPQVVTDNGDIILLHRALYGSDIVFYNPATNSITSFITFLLGRFSGYCYVGSLISPRLITIEPRPRK